MLFCCGVEAFGWLTIGGGVATLLEMLLIVLACDFQEDTAKQILYIIDSTQLWNDTKINKS